MPVILGLSVTFQVLRSTWFAKWAALTQVCKPSFGRLMLVIIFKISLQFSVVFPPAVFLVGKKIICLKHLVHVSTATWSQNGIQILFKIIPILRTRMSCKNLMSCDCGSLSLSLSLHHICALFLRKILRFLWTLASTNWFLVAYLCLQFFFEYQMEFIYFLNQSTFMALLCFFWVIIVKLF